MFRTIVVAASLAGMLMTQAVAQDDRRTGISHKGSLLIFPAVEVEWNSNGNVVLDTILSLTNDHFEAVRVQVYYVNGDEPLDAIYAGNPPTVIREAEPGCNFADCVFELTPNQSVFWSAASGGGETACQPFTVIDPEGRPNTELSENARILRGFVLIWAVNAAGEEIAFNHLTGLATGVDYRLAESWEYSPYAFRVHSAPHGEPSDDLPGSLLLNGEEYDAVFDTLLFAFDASGTTRIVNNAFVISHDADLTLLLMDADLRQNGFEPVTTTVRYDIWNMNERRFSGTQHELTCWWQRLLSRYPAPNNFLRMNLQTDHGKARINSVTGEQCDDVNHLPAPLLGVVRHRVVFSASTGVDSYASALIGSGCEAGAIVYDVPINLPPSLRDEVTPIRQDRLAPAKVGQGGRGDGAARRGQ